VLLARQPPDVDPCVAHPLRDRGEGRIGPRNANGHRKPLCRPDRYDDIPLPGGMQLLGRGYDPHIPVFRTPMGSLFQRIISFDPGAGQGPDTDDRTAGAAVHRHFIRIDARDQREPIRQTGNRAGASPDIADSVVGLSARDYAARDARAADILEILDSAEKQTEEAPVVGPSAN